jgi:hypothetical protein
MERRIEQLSDAGRVAFLSAEDVLEMIREAIDSQARNSLSRSVSERAEKALCCIQLFVDSVAICIQHNP